MEQHPFYDPVGQEDTRQLRQFIPPIGAEAPPNPSTAITKGLEVTRRGLHTAVAVAVGFAACGTYVIYRYGEPGQPDKSGSAPAITVLVSPPNASSPLSPSASESYQTVRPSQSASMSPSESTPSTAASPSATVSASMSPSEVPATLLPTAPVTTHPVTPTPTQAACNPPQGGYEICAVGTSAYSYPDTSRGHVVYQFNQPTVVNPECQNNQGWMLVDFSNPGGAEAGYVHTSAVTGNVGAVAVCS